MTRDEHSTRAPLSVPALLTLCAVLLGVLTMIWPTHRFRQALGPETAQEALTSVWVHGATTLNAPVTTVIRPMGLILFILLMLVAAVAAVVAWRGCSVRADALGILGVALYTGAIIVPTFMALSADVGVPGEQVRLEYGPGLWSGMAASICGIVAAVLFFTQLGRRRPAAVRD